jgi:hypothetical protein
MTLSNIDWNAAFELRLASIETALYNLSEAITELKRVILEGEEASGDTGETLGSEDSERSVDEEDDDYEDEDEEE